MEIVAPPEVIDRVQRGGGALYAWPRKARCCGGMVQLEASTSAPDKVFRRVDADGIELYVTVGMRLPESLYLELGRHGRVCAFWDGLAWLA